MSVVIAVLKLLTGFSGHSDSMEKGRKDGQSPS